MGSTHLSDISRIGWELKGVGTFLLDTKRTAGEAFTSTRIWVWESLLFQLFIDTYTLSY